MPPLEISPAEFRELMDAVGALAAQFVAKVGDRQPFPATSASDTAAFDLPLPEEGLGRTVLQDLAAIAEHVRAPGGRRLPYVVGSGDPVGALGDLYASILNQNVTAWRSAPAAVAVEQAVLSRLADAIGCSGFTGTFTSGGSLANLMALAAARETRAPANEAGVRPRAQPSRPDLDLERRRPRYRRPPRLHHESPNDRAGHPHGRRGSARCGRARRGAPLIAPTMVLDSGGLAGGS